MFPTSAVAAAGSQARMQCTQPGRQAPIIKFSLLIHCAGAVRDLDVDTSCERLHVLLRATFGRSSMAAKTGRMMLPRCSGM